MKPAKCISFFNRYKSVSIIIMGSICVAIGVFLAALLFPSQAELKKQNIVYILADDLGWNDVSFHGSDQIPTPNIDLLAYTGVMLDRFYTHCICTPSRAALLTGKPAYVTGMQGWPITQGEDRYLPLNEKILPQYLKEAGFSTHLVGKWHQGHSRTVTLPTMRGFDTHFGHRGGYVDYNEYLVEETWSTGKVSGYDLYRNMTAAWDAEGYLTDLYTDEAKSIIKSHDASKPLFLMLAHNAPHGSAEGTIVEAPPEEVRRMRHIEFIQRRIYAAMVKKLDDSVGEVVKALADKGILNNTIIVFTSDNGAMTSGDSINYGSNWPLRGIKLSPFEGGVRAVGLVWSANLNPKSHLWEGTMHISDWLPTLLRAVGVEPPSDIDGFDQWENIISNTNSKRNDVVEVDDYLGFSYIISGNYKLITGTVVNAYSNYQGHFKDTIGSPPLYDEVIRNSAVYNVLETLNSSFEINNVVPIRKHVCAEEINITEESLCYPGIDKHCLYDIREDPCETKDISEDHPELVNQMFQRLQVEKNRTIPRMVPVFRDPRSRPSLHGYAWTTWADGLPL